MTRRFAGRTRAVPLIAAGLLVCQALLVNAPTVSAANPVMTPPPAGTSVPTPTPASTPAAKPVRSRSGAPMPAALSASNIILTAGGAVQADRKSTRLNSSHIRRSRMPSSA